MLYLYLEAAADTGFGRRLVKQHLFLEYIKVALSNVYSFVAVFKCWRFKRGVCLFTF